MNGRGGGRVTEAESVGEAVDEAEDKSDSTEADEVRGSTEAAASSRADIVSLTGCYRMKQEET